MYIFIFIFSFIIFNLVVFFHEIGKYITSIKLGVKVNEASFGLGPQIFKVQKNESIYSLRLVPIGFFCSIEKESFNHKRNLSKIIILLSSIFMDILLSFALSIFSSILQSSIRNVKISGFFQNSISDSRGKLKSGDEIISINGYKTHIDTDVLFAISSSNENNFSFGVVRNGEFVRIENISFPTYESKGKKISKIDFTLCKEDKNFINIMIYSSTKVGSFIRMSFKGLTELIMKKLSVLDFSDPICISVESSYVEGDRSSDFILLILNLVYLSITILSILCICNLIPIPPFVGGTILVMLIERIIDKKINNRTNEILNTIGLIFIIGLSFIIIINDILNTIKGI